MCKEEGDIMTTGKRWVSKDKDCKLVEISEVSKYLEDGWSLGMPRKTKDKMAEKKSGDKNPQRQFGSYHRGRIRITNGVENKSISESRLSYYESLGWRRGMTRKEKSPAS